MSTNQSILVIEAGRAERHYWRDLWRYRELFYLLALREEGKLLSCLNDYAPRGGRVSRYLLH